MIRNVQLAKHIADASWGEFIRQLKYKAKWAGRTNRRGRSLFSKLKAL
ncbi:hypothetical protein BTN49_3245 (plasmid) [Candidatus Enterovibrio escicola]|uniref:Mobile element protein n=1 Tax=Candidatus Enterovibrio escicola TaxID=1927127 RepID=A0A2A5SZ67_9GAMM|nr:hypothetical protein BTN49_3245 [Candidatus Enterovibrio escacola]